MELRNVCDDDPYTQAFFTCCLSPVPPGITQPKKQTLGGGVAAMTQHQEECQALSNHLIINFWDDSNNGELTQYYLRTPLSDFLGRTNRN